MGSLQPLDVFVRLPRRSLGGSGRNTRYSVQGDSAGRSRGLPFAVRFSLRACGQIASAQPTDPAGRAAGERVFEIIDEPAESQRGHKFGREVRGEIEFRDVSFSYGTELPALS